MDYRVMLNGVPVTFVEHTKKNKKINVDKHKFLYFQYIECIPI
jgi:hypothetical protein